MSSLSSSLDVLFNKMESFISTKTIIGEPVTVGEIIILPLIEVTFGVGAGSHGNDRDKDKSQIDGGGLGAKLAPSAILVVQNGTAQLVNVKNQDSLNKVIDMVPGIVSKFDFFNGSKKDSSKEGVKASAEDKTINDADTSQ